MTSKTLRVMLALVAIGSLSACGQKSAAEAAVRESLKDPDSAKFGEFYYNAKTKKGCVTVNARNSMGGYTGDQQAFVVRADSGWDVIGISDISQEMCRQIHADDSN